MASKVPNSWDEEDWEKLTEKPSPPSRRPNPTAPPFNPPTAPRILRAAPEYGHPLLYTTTTNTGQPKSLYTPELKILKRSSPDTPGAVTPKAITSEESEKERRERERKEKERRYKEARDRIMGDAVPGAPASSGTTQVAPVEAAKIPRKESKSGKRIDSNTPARTASAGNRHKPTSSPSFPRGPSPAPPSSRTPSRTPSRKPSPPRGAVTSFSLNGGEFAAAPIPTAANRLYSQKIDEKLLESQLLNREDGGIYLGEGIEAEGLDWDSFSRDKGWGPQQQQQSQQSQQWGSQGGDYGYDYTTTAAAAGYDYLLRVQPRQQNPAIYGGSAIDGVQQRHGCEKVVRAPGASQMGVVQAVRAPRGPDSDGGRGFKGRGTAREVNGITERMKGVRLKEGGVREFVPGGSTWGQ